MLAILVPYFKTGLENNEFCLWVTAPPLSGKDARNAMRKAIPQLNRYEAEGRIEIVPFTEWYLDSGGFNAKRVLRRWMEKLNHALERGYEGMRATGNIFWLEKAGWNRFDRYEQTLNKMVEQRKMLILCAHSLEKCNTAHIIDVMRTHQLASLGRAGTWVNSGSTILERTKMEARRNQFLEQAMSAQEKERRNVSHELHDETGQSLMALLVGLRTVQDSHTLKDAVAVATHLRGVASQAIKEIQRLAQGLSPVILDDMGLKAAIERCASDVARAHKIIISVDSVGLDDERLPAQIEIALFRMAQEALTNAVKHAAAKYVNILINRYRSNIQMVVEDDGKGFKPDSLPPSISMGLEGMRERVDALGGIVAIESTPGKGTTIHARIPLERNTT